MKRLIATKALVTINGKEIITEGIYVIENPRMPEPVDLEPMGCMSIECSRTTLNYEDDDLEDEVEYENCHD